ncbi:MAG: hypothetical protein V3T05_12125 [Myxococcota bacterium]
MGIEIQGLPTYLQAIAQRLQVVSESGDAAGEILSKREINQALELQRAEPSRFDREATLRLKDLANRLDIWTEQPMEATRLAPRLSGAKIRETARAAGQQPDPDFDRRVNQGHGRDAGIFKDIARLYEPNRNNRYLLEINERVKNKTEKLYGELQEHFPSWKALFERIARNPQNAYGLYIAATNRGLLPPSKRWVERAEIEERNDGAKEAAEWYGQRGHQFLAALHEWEGRMDTEEFSHEVVDGRPGNRVGLAALGYLLTGGIGGAAVGFLLGSGGEAARVDTKAFFPDSPEFGKPPKDTSGVYLPFAYDDRLDFVEPSESRLFGLIGGNLGDVPAFEKQAILYEGPEERFDHRVVYNFSDHPIYIKNPENVRAVLSVGPVIFEGNSDATVLAPAVYQRADANAVIVPLESSFNVLTPHREEPAPERQHHDTRKLEDLGEKLEFYAEAKMRPSDEERAEMLLLAESHPSEHVRALAELLAHTNFKLTGFTINYSGNDTTRERLTTLEAAHGYHAMKRVSLNAGERETLRLALRDFDDDVKRLAQEMLETDYATLEPPEVVALTATPDAEWWEISSNLRAVDGNRKATRRPLSDEERSTIRSIAWSSRDYEHADFVKKIAREMFETDYTRWQ